MPASVYKLVFQDPGCQKLALSKLEIGTYTTDTVKLVGSCMFHLVHPDTKYLLEVTFYVVSNNGSVLLLYVLGLIQARNRLDYVPPSSSLIASSVDHLKKTKSKISVYVSKKESEVSDYKGMVSKLITSKEQILANYSDVFDAIACFPGHPYHIQVDPSVTPRQAPCQPIPVHLKEAFKKEIDKMLQAGGFKPVDQATPWINSFILVEHKDKQGNVLTQPISIKQLCENHITSRCQKISPIYFQKPVSLLFVDCRKEY